MTPAAVCTTNSITDLFTPNEARTFLELVRIVQQRGNRETYEIRDEAGEAFGFLMLPVTKAPPPDEPEDPEWLRELERRMQSPEPALPVEEVIKFLQEYLQPDQADEPAN